MSGTRTLSIQVEDEQGNVTNRHYNVDNIVYFQKAEWDLTDLGGAVLIGVPLLVGVLIGFIHWIAGVIAAVIALIVLFAVFFQEDGIEIGTLTGTQNLETDIASEFETEFQRASQELLSVEGVIEDTYSQTEYTYHFNPDNIVSIENDTGTDIPLPLLLYVLAVLGGLLGVVAGSILVGIVLFAALAAVGYYVEPFTKPGTVTFQLQNGDSESFTMDFSDSKSIIDQFGRRGRTRNPSQSVGSDAQQAGDLFDRHDDKWHVPDGESEYAVEQPGDKGYRYYKTKRGARDALERWYE